MMFYHETHRIRERGKGRGPTAICLFSRVSWYQSDSGILHFRLSTVQFTQNDAEGEKMKLTTKHTEYAKGEKAGDILQFVFFRVFRGNNPSSVFHLQNSIQEAAV